MTIQDIIRGDGNPKLSAIIMTVGCATNIVLDALFIFGFNMGVKGAALTTIISQATTCIWVLVFLFSKKINLKICKENLSLKSNIILPSLALGISTFVIQQVKVLYLFVLTLLY